MIQDGLDPGPPLLQFTIPHCLSKVMHPLKSLRKTILSVKGHAHSAEQSSGQAIRARNKYYNCEFQLKSRFPGSKSDEDNPFFQLVSVVDNVY